MAYIANRPVRFDRDYKIGEVIPDGVIAPGMARKLADMGRIVRVDLPQGDTAGTQNSAETSPEGTEAAPNGPGEDGGDMDAAAETFICEECGRTFKSQNALAAHSRSHKD